MEAFVQAVAAVLIGTVLCLTLGKQGQEIAVLLGIVLCAGVFLAAARYLQPVLAFLEQMEQMGQLNEDMVSRLFKVTGIGILTEISATVCADAGNGSLGKSLQLLGSASILWLCIPVFNALMDVIQGILGGI